MVRDWAMSGDLGPVAWGGSSPAGGLAEPSGGQDVDWHILEQPGEARAAVIGDQQHAVAAAPEFRRERMGRDHVSAGSSSGQDEVHVVKLSPLHFTTYGERVR